MSDKQYTELADYIRGSLEAIPSKETLQHIVEIVQRAASQPPAVKGAEKWVKIGPTTDPTKTGVYKVRAYDTLHNDGAYLYGSCAYNNEVEEWNANWDEWLDESGESPTAAGDGKEGWFEFVEWVQMSPYSFIRGMGWIHFGLPDKYYTTAQLYDIFKNRNK